MYRRLIAIVLTFFGILLVSCSPSEANIATAIAKTQAVEESRESSPTPTPTAAPESVSGVCEWFFTTQFLRSRRINGLAKFNTFLQEYGAEGFFSSDESVMEEVSAILDDYQPYQEEFVEEWIKLGPHPEAQVFWEKELSSVQLRIEAFDEMIQGLNSGDWDRYISGWDMFEESSHIGREAESAMLEVRSKCID